LPDRFRHLSFASDLEVSAISEEFKVGQRLVSRWLMLAYDDEFSIQYMKKNRIGGATAMKRRRC